MLAFHMLSESQCLICFDWIIRDDTRLYPIANVAAATVNTGGHRGLLPVSSGEKKVCKYAADARRRSWNWP